MTHHDERAEILQQNPCPVCGGTEFMWGAANAGGAQWVNFVPSHVNNLAAVFGVGKKQMAARECSQCGNVLLFTK